MKVLIFALTAMALLACSESDSGDKKAAFEPSTYLYLSADQSIAFSVVLQSQTQYTARTFYLELGTNPYFTEEETGLYAINNGLASFTPTATSCPADDGAYDTQTNAAVTTNDLTFRTDDGATFRLTRFVEQSSPYVDTGTVIQTGCLEGDAFVNRAPVPKP